MFTGIVEAMGEVVSVEPLGDGRRMAFSHPAWEEGVEPGASVAVDGCCVTVVESDAHVFRAELTRETLARSRFSELGPGARVNLERPLAVGARLGGHWVQGHVDGVVTVRQIERRGETCYLGVALPAHARAWVVPQGSVALNGVSLTVLDLPSDDLRVAIIPHTWAHTNLSQLQPGAAVHVEYDILAKYVTSFLNRRLQTDASK